MRNDLLPRRVTLGVFVVAVCGLLVAGIPARAGVVNLTSQTRYVLITTDGGPISLPSETHRQDSADFNPFSATVTTDSFNQPLPGILQRITQDSSMTVSADGAAIVDHSTIHGSISFNPLPAESLFDVEFTLTQAAPFDLTYVGLAGDGRFLQQNGTIINGLFIGPGAPGALAPADLLTYTRGDPLHFSGTLQPGNFQIRADMNADANTGNVDLVLNIGPVSGGSAVPVPPAVWSVLVAMPLLALTFHQLTRSSSRRNP
ncbi:MAG TPA: hypothetical protein VN541_02665 [Tepidisphaeraceae bacterium]|nr:hypothetical protein [Tepidisphaeraceae bacterium]